MSSHFGIRRRRGSGEDGAGWIYADLFLALTIVGLGSASITAGDAFGSDAPTPTTTTVASDATLPIFQLSCVEFGIELPRAIVDKGTNFVGAEIQKRVAREITTRGWNELQAKPGLAILSGGFDEDQKYTDGARLAQATVALVRSSTSLLGGIEIRTTGARVIQVNGVQVSVGAAGDFVLVVYLAYSGPPIEENCET